MNPLTRYNMVEDIIWSRRIVRRAKRAAEATKRTTRGVLRVALGIERQVVAMVMALVLVVTGARGFIAFEAHVVNVTAEVVQLDPPTITPPGQTYSSSTLSLTVSDSDIDATHLFYTVTPGLDPNVAPDPVCGDVLGGVNPLAPFDISGDNVVKAIACDGSDSSAHASNVVTEIYDYVHLVGTIEGHKYHDLDRNGTSSVGDVAIEGWGVELYQNAALVSSTITLPGGSYVFSGLDPGSYTVQEETRTGWNHTSPSVVNVTIVGTETHVVDFYNFDTGFTCVPQQVSFPAGLAVQAAGVAVGNDDVAIANNVTINGDVRSNDDIDGAGGNGPRTINGDAVAGDVIASVITVTGTTSTGASAVSLPDVMIGTWKYEAQNGGTVNGSFNFPNGTVGLSLGPTEIMGNLTFGSSNGATIRGPIYVHGNLVIGSNTTITQDAGFGNQFVPIIVDGTIDIDSNVAFMGAGASGAFLLVSTAAAVAGDGAAIETSSNNSDLGDVVLYASEGDIHINQNRTLLAAFAAHGTGVDSDDNAAVRIDQNVTVNYRELPTQISCGPRQPYESTIHMLINEFMPNPAGSDTGAAGLPHDGEWVELFNPTPLTVDVTGWALYDEVNTNALPITVSNASGSLSIPPGGFLVVYRDGDADFSLDNSGGDSVRLFTNLITSGGLLVDSHTYTVSASDNKSFARIPDGSSNWIDPDGTPGEANYAFFEPLGEGDVPAFEQPNKPVLPVPMRSVPSVPSEDEADTAAVAENDSPPLKDEDAVTGQIEPLPQDVPANDPNVGNPDIDGIVEAASSTLTATTEIVSSSTLVVDVPSEAEESSAETTESTTSSTQETLNVEEVPDEVPDAGDEVVEEIPTESTPDS